MEFEFTVSESQLKIIQLHHVLVIELGRFFIIYAISEVLLRSKIENKVHRKQRRKHSNIYFRRNKANNFWIV